MFPEEVETAVQEFSKSDSNDTPERLKSSSKIISKPYVSCDSLATSATTTTLSSPSDWMDKSVSSPLPPRLSPVISPPVDGIEAMKISVDWSWEVREKSSLRERLPLKLPPKKTFPSSLRHNRKLVISCSASKYFIQSTKPSGLSLHKK